MTHRRPALMVFDMAGTTIRDRGEVAGALTDALGSAGIDLPSEEVSRVRGASKRNAIVQLVARHGGALDERARAVQAAALYERFRAALAERYASTSDLSMPNAVATFERLKRGGLRIALNSGFERAIVDLILGQVAWPGSLLDAVVCGDEVANGRPAPDLIQRSMERTGIRDPRRVAVVGDTRLDIEAGANAGVRYRVGVLSGAHDRATLERAPYTHIVESLNAVPDIWGL
jgi:phosphoglycolate phosphatase